jgi:hypothetical protein
MKNRGGTITLRLVATSLAASMLTCGAGAWADTPPAKPPTWAPKKLADGQPDVQGFWHAEIEGTYSLVNPRTGGSTRQAQLLEHQGKKQAARRSRVSDPEDGQVPYQPWAREKQQHIQANINTPTRPEYIDPQARCFQDGVSRTQWWHDFQIRQYPGYIIFLFDSSTRVIYIDGRPHIPENIKLWMSDSRGHWEGNTLVVDVTNSNAKHRLSNEGDFSSDKVHITERFTFIDADTYRYEARYEDPSVYTRPWTITSTELRAQKDKPDFEFWEYGCHEGERSAEASYLGDKAATK